MIEESGVRGGCVTGLWTQDRQFLYVTGVYTLSVRNHYPKAPRAVSAHIGGNLKFD